MKRLIWVLVAGSLVVACQETEPVKSEFTGNESVFALAQGSAYAINGTVSFKERLDGTTSVVVALSGTEGTLNIPYTCTSVIFPVLRLTWRRCSRQSMVFLV